MIQFHCPFELLDRCKSLILGIKTIPEEQQEILDDFIGEWITYEEAEEKLSETLETK